MSQRTRRTQAERRRTTTGELVATAQRMFGEHGYAAVSIDDIAGACGMTKGAVYHHYSGKAELFRAVFVRQEQQLTQRIAEASLQTDDPWERVLLGSRAFLRACTEPPVRQITLLDGPAVLGWDDVRDIELEHSLRLVERGLDAAAGQGRIAPGDVTVRAHLVFGALCEAGMLIARADDPDKTLDAVLDEVDDLLAGLTRRNSSEECQRQ